MAERDSEHDTSTTDDEWDFEREWARARAATERDQRRRGRRREDEPAEISPYVLLYTGFLLGPPASWLAVLILMGRRFRARVAVFALGICGAAWVTSQAAVAGLAGHWSGVALQMLRTSNNFLVGLVLLWFLRRDASVTFVHDRQTYINTVIFGLLLVVLYASLPHAVLIWLGR